MTIENDYFFDTYAILEIIGGSKAYEPFISAGVILTKLNLFELFYAIMRMHGKFKAVYYLKQYSQFAVPFDDIDIQEAANLKMSNKALSMADCIGYAVSARKGLKFLTGDKEFKDMHNVEFVK